MVGEPSELPCRVGQARAGGQSPPLEKAYTDGGVKPPLRKNGRSNAPAGKAYPDGGVNPPLQEWWLASEPITSDAIE